MTKAADHPIFCLRTGAIRDLVSASGSLNMRQGVKTLQVRAGTVSRGHTRKGKVSGGHEAGGRLARREAQGSPFFAFMGMRKSESRVSGYGRFHASRRSLYDKSALVTAPLPSQLASASPGWGRDLAFGVAWQVRLDRLGRDHDGLLALILDGLRFNAWQVQKVGRCGWGFVTEGVERWPHIVGERSRQPCMPMERRQCQSGRQGFDQAFVSTPLPSSR